MGRGKPDATKTPSPAGPESTRIWSRGHPQSRIAPATPSRLPGSQIRPSCSEGDTIRAPCSTARWTEAQRTSSFSDLTVPANGINYTTDQPDITVEVNPNVVDDTGVVDFGTTYPGTPITKPFTIRNDGGTALIVRDRLKIS